MIGITITLGELVDRITILEIKSKMIKDETKLIDVRKELQQLRGQYHTHGVEVPEMLKQKLDSLNLTLWQVENDLRRKEVNLEFDEKFVELARSVYFTNDLRYDTKLEISKLDTHSTVPLEHKSYV
jgi:hypothetical protein